MENRVVKKDGQKKTKHQNGNVKVTEENMKDKMRMRRRRRRIKKMLMDERMVR
jgi:hypothetical protein